MKQSLLVLIFLGMILSVKGQYIDFANVGVSIDSLSFEIPILARDQVNSLIAYQMGIGLTGDGYVIDSIVDSGKFLYTNTVYNVKRSLILGMDTSGIGIDLMVGDTLAILYLSKILGADSCLVINSPISQIGNTITQIVDSEIVTKGFHVNSRKFCKFPLFTVTNDTTIQNICFGDNIGEIQMSIKGSVGPVDILWTNEQGDVLGNGNPTFSGLANGEYFVNIMDSLGRSYTDSFSIESAIQITYEITESDTICEGSQSGSIDIDGDDSYTYQWSNGAGSSSVSGLTKGDYSVAVIDTFGCSATEIITIYNFQVPTFSIEKATCTTCDDGKVVFSTAFDESITDIEIINEDSMLVDHMQLLPGNYHVLVTYEDGCTKESMVYIPFIADFINAFKAISVITPNSGDDNSSLFIDGLILFPENKLTIFNKWGNIVFQQEHYMQDGLEMFNGEVNGKLLPEGNYYYVLKIKGFAKPLQSSLSIMR